MLTTSDRRHTVTIAVFSPSPSSPPISIHPFGGMRSEFCSDLTSSLSDWGWLTVVDIGLGVWASEKPCTEFTFHGDYEKAGLYYMASVKEVNKPHYYNKAPRIDMHEPSTWVGKGIVLDSQRFTGMLYEIKLIAEVLGKNSLPASIITSFCGGADIGQAIAADTHIPFVSFTRSSKKVSQRFGKCLLELGGNNALIVLDDANVKLVVRSVLFAAVGTAGQRCTTCRRLLKELEKLGPRKGVISQSIKDVVQSLVDDDLFSKDKIGTSSHCNGEYVFLLLESMTHLLTFQINHDQDAREEALIELKVIEQKYHGRIAQFADHDPATYEAMKEATKVAHIN
ncbi:aldehyde dehydrogenase family 7 member B4 [Tanacetum coccineum]